MTLTGRNWLHSAITVSALTGMLLAGAAVGSAPVDRLGPPGTATEVRLGIFVMDVASIDDAKQTFTADFFVILRWTDARLSFAESAGSEVVRVLPVMEVWHPELAVLNQRELRPALPEQVRVSPDGAVLYRQRYQGTLASPLDLRQFPFDQQRPSIGIAVLQGARPVVLHPDPQRTGRMPRFSIAGWDVEVGRMESDSFEPIEDEVRLPRATLPLTAERDVGYYVWKLFVPLGLIVFMAWTVFFIGHDQMGPRIGISTAAIFTLIAFQFSLGRILPPISYLTRADLFALGSSVLVYLALAETILSGKLNVGGKPGLARRIDRHARWIYATLFVVVAVVTLGL
jgi:hypothetical protein